MAESDTDVATADSAQLIEHALNQYGALCEAEWTRARGESNHTSDFLENGIFVKRISSELANELGGFFADDREQPFSAADCLPGYLDSDLSARTEEQLNTQNQYYAPPDPSVARILGAFLGSMEDEIECQLGHPWRVINVRAWAAMPGGNSGPNDWHCDGFSRYVRKLMIFPRPPNLQNGSLEIAMRSGDCIVLEEEHPTAVLIESSILLHRGRPSLRSPRPVIEVTLAPDHKTSSACVFAGQNARVPLDCAADVAQEMSATKFVPTAKPVEKPKSLFRKLKKKASKRWRRRRVAEPLAVSNDSRVTNFGGRVNLGGGPNFRAQGWINLEGAPSAINVFPFRFGEQAVFPVASSSVELVYSSHCFEHLDDPTVDRCLEESRRVIRSDGMLLLKLPDFDKALDCWKRGDSSFFGEEWGLESVATTWSSRDVEDSLDSRAAMVFCGFWNDLYGDHFSRDLRDSGDAYHGPPVQIAAMRQELLTLDSPHEVAARLRAAVIDREPSYTFNHQNAWSRDELRQMLERNGFRVESMDEADLMKRFSDVPGIREMEDISTFCLARPA